MCPVRSVTYVSGRSELLSLEQLRERVPSLRQREQTLRAELQALVDQAGDRAKFLQLAETTAAFLGRLRESAHTLDVIERQRIVRLVVKEILIGDDNLVIRHCIPIASTPRPVVVRRLRVGRTLHHPHKVTFCVRGVSTPPWGVPRTGVRTWSASMMPAFNHQRIRRSTHLSRTRR